MYFYVFDDYSKVSLIVAMNDYRLRFIILAIRINLVIIGLASCYLLCSVFIIKFIYKVIEFNCVILKFMK